MLSNDYAMFNAAFLFNYMQKTIICFSYFEPFIFI